MFTAGSLQPLARAAREIFLNQERQVLFSMVDLDEDDSEEDKEKAFSIVALFSGVVAFHL